MKESPHNIPVSRLADQVSWLIHLRWVAVFGVVTIVYVASRFFRISLPVHWLYGVAIFLAVYNGIFDWCTFHFRKRKNYGAVNVLANVQIFLDLTCLVLLIHFSGGIENPFCFYFIFHIIIAGILLSRRETFILATYAILLFLPMAFFEYTGALHHYCLKGIFSASLHDNQPYLLGVAFVFVSTLYIAAFLTTYISNRLRENEGRLKEANVQLAEKDKIKSEYVLHVTHDIKEDLSAIHSCIEPIQTGLTGPLNAEQGNLLRRAMERSKQLIVYVDALLEMTRLKLAKSLEMNRFSFIDLAHEVSASMSAIAESHQVRLEVQVDPEISPMLGVRVYVQEALLNLLQNAVKYTPPGGKILWDNQWKDGLLRIKVSDTGIGIPKEDLPRIFEEFYRAKNAKAILRKGAGLGLSLTKQIVEMHHGKIWIESEVGRGTCVYLEIPLGR